MTQLPIDYNKRPWRPKYLDEETPELNFWFIHGEYSDGTVDIFGGQDEVMIRVPRKIAEEIVNARQHFVDTYLKYFSNFEEKRNVVA